MIIGGYLIVGAVGSTLIGCAIAERYLGAVHHFRSADIIGKVVGKSLPWALIAGALWAIFHIPFI